MIHMPLRMIYVTLESEYLTSRITLFKYYGLNQNFDEPCIYKHIKANKSYFTCVC